MPELRISDVRSGAGWRVEVTWRDDGASPRLAVAEISAEPNESDSELIRWYLEDYSEYPVDPAQELARSAEDLITRDGTELFRRVFASEDAVGIWDQARDRLGDVRIEVDADAGEGTGLAWELLRDPSGDKPVALSAGAFVRTQHQATRQLDLPVPSEDGLRVLLVICRPGGNEDVPFRSVASRLVRHGAGRLEGLELDVLRPASFARLSQVLHAAKAAGRPYHVVHFDGHGTYLDVVGLGINEGATSASGRVGHGVSVAGPARAGRHGYLLFEDPSSEENTQLVDGLTLGRLLVETGVPVLVLNACRSAYVEASRRPGQDGDHHPAGQGNALTGDVHARIRAYGSLAAEVADVGVPGVVAMRYNVYVVTAAQFVADLYAHLLAGRSLGVAATAARRTLAADPGRQVGPVPVALQDWVVPVVYESAPLELLRTDNRPKPAVRLTDDGAAHRQESAAGVPRSPDVGFFGRDETLLALDRAFDRARTVLLHAYAGAGKSSVAAEFARWYQVTGGLGDSRSNRQGTVLWSSFEQHVTVDRAIAMAGDHFAGLLQANGIHWAAVTGAAERRDLVMRILGQIPVLWVWDNIEPVTGFPVGTKSAWTPDEQGELASLLRDLAQQTQCKILLTSRRDERAWLGDLPARVSLPGMPMRECIQLAAALVARGGRSIASADWRPLLRFAGGNPLTITVTVGQALRENRATSEQITEFTRRLRAGEAQIEEGEAVSLGRPRSLAASLGYGLANAFTEAERAQLAVLHLFRETVGVGPLCFMGDADQCEADAVPELAGLDPDTTGTALFDRATDIGLLTSLGGHFYRIHPALPWYFSDLFASTYGEQGTPSAQRAMRAYARVMGELGHTCVAVEQDGHDATDTARISEANLLHALEISRTSQMWEEATGCMQGLLLLYTRTGRSSEWARLVSDITPDVTDPGTGGPLPGRAYQWELVTSYRARIAHNARDWATETGLRHTLIAWTRDQVAETLTIPDKRLTRQQRTLVHSLGAEICQVGDILQQQGDPGCVAQYREAFALMQRIGDELGQSRIAHQLGNAYLDVSAMLDLSQAAHWYEKSLRLLPASDLHGRSEGFASLASVALRRFEHGRRAGEHPMTLKRYLTDALNGYQQSLRLHPIDDHQTRARRENEIGISYAHAGDFGQSLRHLHVALHHSEACGDVYTAGLVRGNIAGFLERQDKTSEAVRYARAAMDNYRQVGPSAAAKATEIQQFITFLEIKLEARDEQSPP